jgi:two-component system NtrC family sensor kinase
MFQRFRLVISSCLRYKLLTLVLLPVLLVMTAVVALSYLWLNDVSYQQLLMKVNADLKIAHEAFEKKQQTHLSELALLAESYHFRLSLEQSLTKDEEALQIKPLVNQLKEQRGFDFVQMIDANGCDYWNEKRCNSKNSPLLSQALSGEPAIGVDLFSSKELHEIDPKLAEMVFQPLVETPKAHPVDSLAENRGMVLHSYYPILNDEQQVTGVLIGGVLLNRNFEFVDSLRDLVYSKGTLAEDSLGTVTIFLDDVRISTNVPEQLQSPELRAIGTRVSDEVREQVLGYGKKWIDRAFVVSDWYISAYEPIVDVYGNRVGMIYTGFLEAPFRATFFTGLTLLLLIFTVVVIIAVLLAVFGAKSIYKPIEAMANVIKTIEHGAEERIGQLDSNDEVAVFAQQFDGMLDTLQAQRAQIQNAADELELKVEDRTQQLQRQKIDLQQSIRLLKQTREKLVANEKLAAIGELTAGIAHEINNPTAVILGNMDLLVDELGEQAKPVEQQTELIIQQVFRIRSIINNLLQYSRPDSFKEVWSDVDMNSVINDTLALVHHDINRHSIELSLDLRSKLFVKGNHQKFQQVLINLLVNATNARSQTPKIIVRTRDWKNKGVLMVIKDNGRGIDSEILPRIFDPFFTQTSSGTGLGLYVSSGILNHFGAEIRVRSRVGVGTCFYIWFYCDPEAKV